MDLAEDFIQYVIKYTDKCQDDLKFLETRLLDEENQNHRQKEAKCLYWKN
jgi:asparaginyl-tRNA synthetase